MKIIRVVLLVAACSILGFNMGVNGCSGQIEDPNLVEGVGVDATEATMDMPILTVVNGLTEGEDPMLGDKCLMNYVPDEANFVGSIEPQGIRDTLYKFGLDNFKDEEVKQDIDDAVTNIQELVGFALDDGQFGILVRIKDGMTMSEFVDGYLTEAVQGINEGVEDDSKKLIPRVVDESTVIVSQSLDVNGDVATRVEQDRVEYECAFYRINKCSEVNSRPMLYLLAKGKTTLLDEPLSNAVPEMMADIQKSIAVLGIDKKDGVFRFYFGALDNEDVLTANVITYFSFYIDMDSYLLSTAIDTLTDQLFNAD